MLTSFTCHILLHFVKIPMNRVLIAPFHGPENQGSAKLSNLPRIIVSKWLRQALNSDQLGSDSLSTALVERLGDSSVFLIPKGRPPIVLILL